MTGFNLELSRMGKVRAGAFRCWIRLLPGTWPASCALCRGNFLSAAARLPATARRAYAGPLNPH